MKRNISVLLRGCCATLVLMAFAAAATSAAEIDDADALKSVKVGKAVFDISLGDPAKLALHLAVIKETHQGLVKQGVKPDLIVLFRGPAVLLVSKKRAAAAEPPVKPDETAKFTAELTGMSMKEITRLTEELKGLGVKFEVCGVSTRLLKVDNATVLPETKVVANTFISLIGYENRGYAIVPIM